MTRHLWQRTAGELARMIAHRQVTSAAVVEAHLSRIEVINPRVNAIVRITGRRSTC
jgi:amidase